MAGKLGLARLEAMLENIGREIDLSDSTLVYKEKTQNVNAAKNLTPSDCGTILLGVVGTQQGAGTGFNVNLPAPEAGLHFKFVLVAPTIAANANAAITITSTSDGETAANISLGSVTEDSDTNNIVGSALKDVVTFVHAKATAGDYAEAFCDGTNWIWNIFSDASDAMTLA